MRAVSHDAPRASTGERAAYTDSLTTVVVRFSGTGVTPNGQTLHA